jgi:2-hydroxychromene-2-carboxylate isomerase
MRAATGLLGSVRFSIFLEATFEGFWQTGLDMADDGVVDNQLRKHGLDPAAVREIAAKAETKAALKDRTEAAVAHGLFGCPMMVVEGHLSFGQDRMIDVEEAVTGCA